MKKQFWPKAKYYFSIQLDVLRKIWSWSKNLGQRKYNLCLYTQAVVQSVCIESCLNTACTCVCYFRNTTSQQYRTPPNKNKIHSVQTVSLTQENKCKKFTSWSQLPQYSTTQNQRHFNHKQKNCSISAKTLQMIQKWILFVWIVTLYCLNYRESDYALHTNYHRKLSTFLKLQTKSSSLTTVHRYCPLSTLPPMCSFFETLLLSMQTVFPAANVLTWKPNNVT